MAAGHFLSKTIQAMEYKMTGLVNADKKPYVLSALETGSPKKFMSLTAYPDDKLTTKQRIWSWKKGEALILAPFQFNTKILDIEVFSQNNIQAATAKIGLFKIDKASLSFEKIECIDQDAFDVQPNNAWVTLKCKELYNCYTIRELIKVPAGYGTDAGDGIADKIYDDNMSLSEYYLALVCETPDTTKADDTIYKVKIEFTDTGSLSTAFSKHIL